MKPELEKEIRAAREEAEKERDTIQKHLSNLLARIHGDGGQHEIAAGTDQAVSDADNLILNLKQERDEAMRALKDMVLLSIHPEYHTFEWVRNYVEWRVNKAIEVACAEIEKEGREMNLFNDRLAEEIIKGNQEPIWISRGCPTACVEHIKQLESELAVERATREKVGAELETAQTDISNLEVGISAQDEVLTAQVNEAREGWRKITVELDEWKTRFEKLLKEVEDMPRRGQIGPCYTYSFCPEKAPCVGTCHKHIMVWLDMSVPVPTPKVRGRNIWPIRPESDPILCDYVHCAFGMGQAGSGRCPGDWTKPGRECLKFTEEIPGGPNASQI